MKHITPFGQFQLNENNEFTPIILSEIGDEEIRVYEDNIKRLLNFIGEGIDEINISTINRKAKFIKGGKTPQFYPIDDEFQNEIIIIFFENAWGGIDSDEWQKADKILQSMIGIGGLTDFSINASRSSITLEFETDLPIGLY